MVAPKDGHPVSSSTPRDWNFPPLLWVKKEEITGGRKADSASKLKPPTPLAQGGRIRHWFSSRAKFRFQNDFCVQ